MSTNEKGLELIPKELTSKVLITLGLLILVRIGTFIPVPGIDQEYLSNFIKNSPISGFLNTFSGGGTFVIGIFTLNIFPYINASILMQLLVSIVPSLEKLQKEEGAAGRRKITQITRLISLGWAILQSTSIAFFLKSILFNWNLNFAFEIILCLTVGSMIVMWISEIITEHGIGNGASLLIFTNIVSNLPNLAKNLLSDQTTTISFASKILITLVFFIAISGIVYLQEGVRMVPLVSSKELNVTEKGFANDLGTANYIPLRLNQAGVMPIIFTAALLVLPVYILNSGLLPIISIEFLAKFSKILYWIAYFSLILGFSYFYSTIVLNPKDISNDLRKMAVTVPGIRPGESTTYFFKETMTRITFIGAIFLATIATLPNVIEGLLNISNLKGLGTTSLLILVGVTIDTTREVRSVILSNIYKDMVKSK
jgi:preprotein translocase subunit SecY